MLTLKLQAKDYELTLLPPPHKLKADPYPKQSQDQSLFQVLLISVLGVPSQGDMVNPDEVRVGEGG